MKKLLLSSLLLNVVLFGFLVHPWVEKLTYRLGVSDHKNTSTSNSDQMAVFSWENSLVKYVDTCEVALLGNSLIQQSDFRPFFPGLRIVNLGYAGDDIIGITQRCKIFSRLHAQKVFVMAGTNGSQYISDEAFRRRYALLLEALMQHATHSQLYVMSLLPVGERHTPLFPDNDRIIQLNAIIRTLCEERHLTYIDLFSVYYVGGTNPHTVDGVHLRPEAYKKWAETLRPYL